MRKKFLIPVAAAAAALAGNSQASVPSKPAPALNATESSGLEQSVSASHENQATGRISLTSLGNQYFFATTKAPDGQVLAWHESHASHASHGSHRSHYSGR
jgi:hypothetical protein